MAYSIWLEFEEYADTDVKELDDGFCNVEVEHDDGRREAYNVWTLEYFRHNVQRMLDEVEEKGFVTLPDIIVRRLDRPHITEVLEQIVVD